MDKHEKFVRSLRFTQDGLDKIKKSFQSIVPLSNSETDLLARLRKIRVVAA